MRRIAILSLFISGLVFSQAVKAQEMVPLTIPSIIASEDVSTLGVDFDDAFNEIPNAYLSDTMKLNYQISLLDKLVARASAIDKISESYAALGIVFTPPPPPRGICAQLPVNGPCLAAYPDMFSELVASRKAYYKTLEIKAKDSEPGRKPGESDDAMIARQKKQAAEAAARAEAIARRTRYQWSELTCLSGQCYGVLVRKDDPSVRYTVRTGTKLPDGTTVESVKPGDVRISINGEMIVVRPSPGGEENAAAVAASAAINPLSQTLAGSGVDAGGVPSPSRSATASVIANAGGAATPEAAPIASAPVTTPLPPVSAVPAAPTSGAAAPAADAAPLGPSGLF